MRHELTADHIELLRRVAISDEDAVSRVLGGLEPTLLDDRTYALVRLATLVVVDPAEASLRSAIETANAAGVESEEMFRVVRGLTPIIGQPTVERAIAAMGVTMGSDLATSPSQPGPGGAPVPRRRGRQRRREEDAAPEPRPAV